MKKFFTLFVLSFLASCTSNAQKKSEELLETFDGRVLIRKSGTEHKIRIMVESNSQEATSEQSVLLTELVESIS